MIVRPPAGDPEGERGAWLTLRSEARHLPDAHGWRSSQPPSEDERSPIGRYLRILRNRWKIVATSFVVVTTAVGVGVAITPPTYRATGTIEIRKQATEVVPVDALFQFERISEQYLQTEYGTLRSRALLERAAADPRLARRLRAAFGGNGGSGSGATPTAAGTSRLVDEMQGRLQVSPVEGSRIIRVGFDSPDRALSADVVNALVEHYMDMRRAAGAAALERLAEQADSVRARLLEAEHELQAYVRANGLGPVIVAGSAGQSVPQERLRRLQEELTEAETDGYRAAAVSGTVRESAPTVESDLLKNLRVRIAQLEGEYARMRGTFTDGFPRMQQLRGELAQLDSLLVVEQQRVSGVLSSQHEAALHRQRLLQAAVQEQHAHVEAFAGTLAEYERRQRDVESLEQLYAMLQQKRKEAAVSAALSPMDIAVVDRAAPPLHPLRPRPKRDLALAGLTGLLLGIGLGFLREYTDGTVRTADELHDFGAGSLLASIPSARAASGRWIPWAAGNGHWPRIDDGAARNSPIAEAFRGLRTSVLFDAGGSLPRTLLVTSAAPGDGKTTISTNFALSLTMVGYRVLLVDADLRRPSLHTVFGRPQRPGLAEHLQGIVPWQRARQREVRPRLDVLTAGRGAVSPSDLFSNGAVHRWLAQAALEYDCVILDAPALHIHAPDARILAHATEGVLLVVRSGSTSRDVVRRLMAQTPNVVGVILNQLSPKQLPGSYGAYGHRPTGPPHPPNGAGRPGRGERSDSGAAASLT